MITNEFTRIVLGVSGGIAAYKSADLCRRLIERGCEVQVVMTAGAREFITPLTLQAVSANPVHTSLLDETAEAGMGHIQLARWAELVLIAPATAHCMAKLAHGLADDLLSTLCLATEAPIWLAPAMNQQMWAAQATQANAHTLGARGVRLLGPGVGDQACGEVGAGRMLEPLEIATAVSSGSAPSTSAVSALLTGTSVLVTAGPTREALDPVRYITNHSSGKMGYAVACAARDAGANVTLVSGPTTLDTPQNIDFVSVESADDMHEAVMARAGDVDIFIGSAAVADYRPARYSGQKIKKDSGGGGRSLDLERTQDIIASVSQMKKRPFTVGFAAETENLQGNALSKLERKRLDMIAANVVGQAGTGFGSDDNALTLYWQGGSQTYEKMPKHELAAKLVTAVARRYLEEHSA
jgi:phosphopantothenoylcysteine decarboxylase/phosphopantothenate--cysteine ligase